MAGNVKLMTSAGGGVVLDTATTTATDVTVKVPVTGVNNGTLVCSDSSGNVGIGTSSPVDKLNLYGTSTVYQRWQTSGTGTSNTDGFQIGGDTNVYLWNYENGFQAFATNNTERMRIDSNGNLLVGTTSQFTTGGWTPKFTMDSGGDGVAIINVNNGYSTQITKASAAHTYYAGQYLNSSGTSVGKITVSTTGTTYVTTSDYRLKDNVQPMGNALSKVLQLNPVTYTWKENGAEGQGFIAHELQAVVPDCVVGEKDGLDRNGNPEYQGIDTSFLVATLTKAIQELSAKNDALEARITALEAK